MMSQNITQNFPNIPNKFECGQCGIHFDKATYWFDSLYAANWPIREIIPFCSPKCVQEWYEKTGAIDWPLREPKDYPKEQSWKPTQQIFP